MAVSYRSGPVDATCACLVCGINCALKIVSGRRAISLQIHLLTIVVSLPCPLYVIVVLRFFALSG